jgi:hypothetical protein
MKHLLPGLKSTPLSRHAIEWGGLMLLLATTCFWGILGARVQAGNADQLVDSYLFESGATFDGASFPKQHTFLLKWPLFWLQSAFGLNHTTFLFFTLACVLFTVGGLAYLLYRIEKRPAVRGLLYIGLASVLLLIPTVPYAGALLPTNFAMLTTRNLEYLLFILAIVALAANRWSTNSRLGFGTALLWLLFVSDGLFPALSLGGAVLLLMLSLVAKRRYELKFATRWLGAGVAAYLLSVVSLWIVGHMTSGTIVGDGQPYRLVRSAHDAGLAVFYGLTGLLTNYGANPAHSALTLEAVPRTAASELGSWGLIGYLINLALFGLALLAAFVLVRSRLQRNMKERQHQEDTYSVAEVTALALLASTAVAGVSFVVTKHYYVVDSRYLALFTFSGIVATAVYLRKKQLSFVQIKIGIIVGCISLVSAMLSAVSTYHQASQANESFEMRNKAVASTLSREHLPLLVGDYWSVIPIKLQANDKQVVLPMSDCSSPRTVLTSTTWQSELSGHRFAYLLTTDTRTDYPVCTYETITRLYGKPDRTMYIPGTTVHGSDTLLFYDHGVTLQR